MLVFLENRELEKLYVTGSSKKLRLPAEIIEKFFATLQKIQAAHSTRDLLSDNGLRFKKMEGFPNRYSMRLNVKYRLEMEIKWLDSDQQIGAFHIMAITNHYQ